MQTNLIVDLLAGRADVAARAGPLKSASLAARRLDDTAMIVVASPAYLAPCGRLKTVEDLNRRTRLRFGYVSIVDDWTMRKGVETTTIPVVGRVQVSDGEALRRLALGGARLTRLAEHMARCDIAAGRLFPALVHLSPGDREASHAIHLGLGELPSQLGALLNPLTERGKAS